MTLGAVPIAVLASGRGSNFEALVRGDTGPGEVTLLLSDRPDAPVLTRARTLGVDARYMYPGPYKTRFAVEEEKKWADLLLSRGIRLVCLAGLMRMLKGPLLDAFPGAILNVHPSLLPAFPGLDAQGQALIHGVKVSGCTVHYVDRGMDTGPILLQETVPVLPEDDRTTLAERILQTEHRLYPRAVRVHLSGNARPLRGGKESATP